MGGSESDRGFVEMIFYAILADNLVGLATNYGPARIFALADDALVAMIWLLHFARILL
jgi:hypothetical protein